MARTADRVGVAGGRECEPGIRVGVRGGWRMLRNRGERAGRLIAIKPTLISTMAHIARLLSSTVMVLVSNWYRS